MPPSPRRLNYEDLRAEANDFLVQHWPTREIPVDIDHIVDVELAVDVVPVPRLMSDSEIDGFLSADLSKIWVDEFVYSDRLHRYRFTLAHEVGHWWLHRDLYEAADFSTIDGYKEFIESIPDEAYGWYEWQAYCFGGLVLVPREPLAERITESLQRAQEQGFEPDLDKEPHRGVIAEWIGRRFEVAAEVILKRGAYDGHWPK